MSITPKITRASTLRILQRELTFGHLDSWLSSLNAPNTASVRIRVEEPGRGEQGSTWVTIEATWEEGA